MILFVFVFILGASSGAFASEDSKENDVKAAARMYSNSIDNWEFKPEISINKICNEFYDVKTNDVRTSLHERYKAILKDLIPYCTEISLFEFVDNEVENFENFITEIDKINKQWKVIKKKENILNYFKNIIKIAENVDNVDYKVDKSITYGLMRILPRDEKDYLHINTLNMKLRTDLNGIERMFLINSMDGGNVAVGDYTAAFYAIFKLSNIDKNPYFDENHLDELVELDETVNEDIKQLSEADITDVKNLDEKNLHEKKLQNLLVDMLKKLNKIWVNVTKEGHRPHKKAFIEYLNIKRNEDNTYIMWLKKLLSNTDNIELAEKQDENGLFVWLEECFSSENVVDAAVDYLNSINNWTINEEATIDEFCGTHKVEKRDLAIDLIYEKYMVILKRLKNDYGQIQFFDNSKREWGNKHYFELQIEKLNKDWTSTPHANKKNILDYLKNIITDNSSDKVEKAIINGIIRILPRYSTDESNINGICTELRIQTKGVERMFLVDLKNGEKIPDVNDYKQVAYAIYTLSNYENNNYYKRNDREKLTEIKNEYEKLYAVNDNADEKRLRDITTKVLNKTNEAWVFLTKKNYSPYKKALNEYFELNKNGDNKCIQWLKKDLKTIQAVDSKESENKRGCIWGTIDCIKNKFGDDGGLFKYLEKVLKE